jgi:hypothetical protein
VDPHHSGAVRFASLLSRNLKEWNWLRLSCAGIPETWSGLGFQAGVRSKGQDRGLGGARLKICKCVGLEEASCGVEPFGARRPSGVRIPFPAPNHAEMLSCARTLELDGGWGGPFLWCAKSLC